MYIDTDESVWWGLMKIVFDLGFFSEMKHEHQLGMIMREDI